MDPLLRAGTRTSFRRRSRRTVHLHAVNGSNNAIEVNSASSVSFTGSNNELEYKKGNAPRVANDIGTNNVVSQD